MRNSRNLKLIIVILLIIILCKDTQILNIIMKLLDSLRIILIKLLTLLGELFK